MGGSGREGDGMKGRWPYGSNKEAEDEKGIC